jgi:hypothetical protein
LGGSIVANDEQIITISMALIDEIPDGAGKRIVLPKPVNDVETLVITNYIFSNDKWHIFYCSSYVADEGFELDMSLKGIDSIRFSSGGVYVAFPNDTTPTTINIRAHFDIDFNYAESYISLDHDASYTVVGMLDQYYHIGGNTSDTLDMHLETNDTSYCDFNLKVSQTLLNIYIDSGIIEGEECPPAGSININASINVECVGNNAADSLSLDGNWTASIVFNDQTITATYSDGHTRWVVNEDCDAGGGLTKSTWAKKLLRYYSE